MSICMISFDLRYDGTSPSFLPATFTIMEQDHSSADAIDPVYLTSRTAKQIHDLSQVEKVRTQRSQ